MYGYEYGGFRIPHECNALLLAKAKRWLLPVRLYASEQSLIGLVGHSGRGTAA